MGHKFVIESFAFVRKKLEKTDSALKHTIVTTRVDNYAQKLYKKALVGEVEATIHHLYSDDEAIMIARYV